MTKSKKGVLRRQPRIGTRTFDGVLPRPQRRKSRNRGSGIFRTRSVYRAPQGKTVRLLLHPMRFRPLKSGATGAAPFDETFETAP